jgi:sulfite reductase (NADPH) hemoprotein beta-component
VPDAQRDAINALLAEHQVPVDNQASILQRASMACPALPTCGLALAESERFLPNLLGSLELLLKELGLVNEEIIVRMTGCPNGCARPFMAEIGFVGRAPNKYQIHVGGNEGCTRLNRLFKENVKGDQLLDELRPLLTRFAGERIEGERFGDFCERVLWKDAAVAA